MSKAMHLFFLSYKWAFKIRTALNNDNVNNLYKSFNHIFEAIQLVIEHQMHSDDKDLHKLYT